MAYRQPSPRDPRALTVNGVATFALVPLRIFLGGTFLYAGLDKLLDPTFLASSGPGSIAAQLTAFARDSPLAFLINGIALHMPILIGLGMALLEILIGLGTLFGVLFRFSAALGAAVALLFWLTASWAVTPYFYGPDLPYAAGWLTLALAGDGGAWTLPRWLEQRRLASMSPVERRRLARGWSEVDDPDRRRALQLIGLGAATLALSGPAFLMGRISAAAAVAAAPSQSPLATPGPSPSARGSASASATAAPSTANLLASGADLAANGSVATVDPVTGDPVVVIKLPAGSVVAYDAICTHAGCTVQYDRPSVTLWCPCHGAQFDAAHQAAVLAGPTVTPLPAIPITVDRATGNVSRKA